MGRGRKNTYWSKASIKEGDRGKSTGEQKEMEGRREEETNIIG